MNPQPQQPPKMTYVVMNNLGQPHFANESFERCMERISALMRGQLDMTNPPSYHIVQVEAD